MPPPTLPTETSRAAAGFWSRAVAWLIDAGLVALLPVVAVTMYGGAGRFNSVADAWRELGTTTGQMMLAAAERGDAPMAMLQSLGSPSGLLRPAITAFVSQFYAALWPVIAAFIVLGLLYWPLQEASRDRATLGKRVLGLRTTQVNGAALNIQRAYLRHLAGSLSWLTLNIGHLMAAKKPRHQALHDRLVNTEVIWQANARQRVPVWAWLLLLIAMMLPLLLAMIAVGSLMAAIQAAFGI